MERTLAALAPYVDARHAGHRAGTELPARLPRRDAGADAAARRQRRWPGRRCCWRNFLPANMPRAVSICRSARCRKRRCCTATAIKRRSMSWARSKATLRLIPELERRDRRVRAAAAWLARSATSRHHRCVAENGRTVVAAGCAQSGRRHPHRGRRYVLPAPDPRRLGPRRAACRPRAGDERCCRPAAAGGLAAVEKIHQSER